MNFFMFSIPWCMHLMKISSFIKKIEYVNVEEGTVGFLEHVLYVYQEFELGGANSHRLLFLLRD